MILHVWNASNRHAGIAIVIFHHSSILSFVVPLLLSKIDVKSENIEHRVKTK